MKGVIISIALFFAIISVGFSAEKGGLDLPDIFVWGEDRSQVPGIGKKDMFLSPYLRKSNFLSPLRVKDPLKINPKDDYSTGVSGLKIYSALGSFGEYVLRITKAKYVKGNWFYDCDVMGNKKYIRAHGFNYNDIRGSLNIGKNYGFWGWKGGASGIASETRFKKDIWRADAGFFIDAGKISFSPEFAVKAADIEHKKAVEYNLNFKIKAPLFYNQWIMTGLGVNEFGYDRNSKNWSQVSLSYLNTLFRDFSFLINIGYRNKSGEKITYGSRLTGELMDTGYSIYYEKKNLNRDMYLLCKTYPYLMLKDIYETEIRNTLGFKLNKDFEDIAQLNLDFNYNRIKDYLALVDSSSGLFPDNLNERVDITQLKASLKRDWVTAGGIFRKSSADIPYLFSELEVSVSPEIYITGKKPFRCYTSLNYIYGHKTWKDIQGKEKTDVKPYLLWNMEISYEITMLLNLRTGVENLLSRKVLVPGGFYENEPKFYFMVTLGYSEKK